MEKLDRMDWSNETILEFLKLYKGHPCIWNPKDKHYKNRTIVNDAWIDIQNHMSIPCNVLLLKQKKGSLMSSYRSYRCKVLETTVAGGPEQKPTWFAFEMMDSFLRNIYVCSQNSKSDGSLHIDDDSMTEIDIKYDKNLYPDSDEDIKPFHTYSTPIKRPYSPYKPQTIRHHSTHEMSDDECDIITRLWARKLKKLPEERRDILIYKINNLIYKENIVHRNSFTSKKVEDNNTSQMSNDSNSSDDEQRSKSGEYETSTIFEGTAKGLKTITLFKR